MDRHAYPGHARRIDAGQVVAVPDRNLGLHLDLAPQVKQERLIGHVHHLHALKLLQALHDPIAYTAVVYVDRNISDCGYRRAANDVDGHDIAPALADGGCNLGEGAHIFVDFQANNNVRTRS